MSHTGTVTSDPLTHLHQEDNLGAIGKALLTGPDFPQHRSVGAVVLSVTSLVVQGTTRPAVSHRAGVAAQLKLSACEVRGAAAAVVHLGSQQGGVSRDLEA